MHIMRVRDFREFTSQALSHSQNGRNADFQFMLLINSDSWRCGCRQGSTILTDSRTACNTSSRKWNTMSIYGLHCTNLSRNTNALPQSNPPCGSLLSTMNIAHTEYVQNIGCSLPERRKKDGLGQNQGVFGVLASTRECMFWRNVGHLP